MTAESVIELVQSLRERGVVDALVGVQTRPHSDVDLWLLAAELDLAIAVFAERGLDRLLPWGGDRPWNFALHDGRRLRVDLHLCEVLPDGSVHYGSVVDGHTFPGSALRGEGAINGYRVRCEAPEWSLRWHTGHPPREVDRQGVAVLREQLGSERPAGR